LPLGQNNNNNNPTKEILGNYDPKSLYLKGIKKLNLPYLNMSPKHSEIYSENFLTYSEIWQSLHVDDHQPTYFTKLKNKKTLDELNFCYINIPICHFFFLQPRIVMFFIVPWTPMSHTCKSNSTSSCVILVFHYYQNL